jgi:hypothetical protein
MGIESKAVANELNEWFQSVQQLTEAAIFNIAPDGPHREAVVLDTLRRNGRTLHKAKLDPNGKLYSPLCFFLVAACRYLRTNLGIGHWLAALDNVRDVQKQLASSRSDSMYVGLDFGTPATLFKAELDEAIRQAGLIDGTSFLRKEDRQVAIGLAINWGIRLLLAYALQSSTNDIEANERKNLSWLGGLVRLVA